MDMRKNNSADRRIRKTKKVLKESLAILLLKKNINNITIKELVDLADVNRGTFYLHYRDIYDMLAQIETEMLNDLEDISNKFPAALLKESAQPYICEIFQYIADNQTFCKMLLSPHGDMAFVDKLKKLVEEKCFCSLMESFPENALQHYQYFAAYTVSGCIGLLQTWIETGMKVSPRELSQVAEGMIQNGIDFLHREASSALPD
ncbi:MAG: TetR/AcrR family transcriptional regulator [Syntrophomonadaceae bacterium]|nr:TetR/AcrR family transcriptional regulator [Syntrophomonadaceae bacterium]